MLAISQRAHAETPEQFTRPLSPSFVRRNSTGSIGTDTITAFGEAKTLPKYGKPIVEEQYLAGKQHAAEILRLRGEITAVTELSYLGTRKLLTENLTRDGALEEITEKLDAEIVALKAAVTSGGTDVHGRALARSKLTRSTSAHTLKSSKDSEIEMRPGMYVIDGPVYRSRIGSGYDSDSDSSGYDGDLEAHENAPQIVDVRFPNDSSNVYMREHPEAGADWKRFVPRRTQQENLDRLQDLSEQIKDLTDAYKRARFELVWLEQNKALSLASGNTPDKFQAVYSDRKTAFEEARRKLVWFVRDEQYARPEFETGSAVLARIALDPSASLPITPFAYVTRAPLPS